MAMRRRPPKRAGTHQIRGRRKRQPHIAANIYMRIICVTASLPHGTDEPFVIPEINELVRLGHEVLVVPRSPRGRILHGHEIVNRSRREGLYSRDVLKTAAGAALKAPRQIARALGWLLGSRSPAVAVKNFAIV